VAKLQTRRTVSLNRQLFEDARRLAADLGTSLSQLTEAALRDIIAKRTRELRRP
jgi:hypothetical protein